MSVIDFYTAEAQQAFDEGEIPIGAVIVWAPLHSCV